MKKIINHITTVSVMIVFLFTSCNETWDTHYASDSMLKKSDLNLYEYMKTEAELSTFCEMLKITGYDSVLSKPNTYTVWAPVNDALLSINLTDTTTVTEIVLNHISLFSYPTSGIDSKEIYMLDKKFVSFKMSADGYTFGGKDILLDKSNVAASNGILHLLNGYVPYTSNIWEYIGKTPGLDSLRNYLYSQSVYVFDPNASVEIGTNDHGQAIYDSVITFTNPILDKIGSLYVEDSVYTALLPNNTAWTKAYNLIKDKYKTLGADGVSLQRQYTQFAIVKNLIFKEAISSPMLLDSVISTSGNVFKNPSYLFDNSTQQTLSNGYGYVTDSIRFKAEDSYQQSIVLEAENSSYGRSFDYANLYIRSSLGSAYNDSVSENKYLVIESNTVNINTPGSATFPIPNTLSGTYNIYCVFVPSSIISATDIKGYKFKFYLSYMGSDGVQVNNAVVTSTHAVVNKPGFISATFTSKGQVMTKAFVAQFTFPYCNIFNKGDASSSITTKLKVENAAKITESFFYDYKNLRVDRIILEPVQ